MFFYWTCAGVLLFLRRVYGKRGDVIGLCEFYVNTILWTLFKGIPRILGQVLPCLISEVHIEAPVEFFCISITVLPYQLLRMENEIIRICWPLAIGVWELVVSRAEYTSESSRGSGAAEVF